jgi:putative restriction endonuclease
VKIYIGNTDPAWYGFLAQSDQTSEVNFWRPSGRDVAFRAIAVGELFFFRLRNPVSKIVGFGTLAHHSTLPLLMAWEAFGSANGCATPPEFISLIAKYRGEKGDRRTALGCQIGCTILTDVHYYPETHWLDFPFRPGLVQGKSLDIASDDGARVWNHMRDYLASESLLGRVAPSARGEFSLVREEGVTYSAALRKERRGQGAFRIMVLDAYNRRCCVTGERTLPVIQAAHIQPYVSPESNHIQNGLALREDIHTLFDDGYVAVDETLRFLVSSQLREDFENGREYQRLHGKPILVPGRPQLAPNREAIRWHLEHIYLG